MTKFIYNNEVRIGRVERITEKTILVETKDGFRSFKLNQITKENDEVHIVKYRGAVIRWNGNNWESDSGEVVRLENIDEYPPTNFFRPVNGTVAQQWKYSVLQASNQYKGKKVI